MYSSPHPAARDLVTYYQRLLSARRHCGGRENKHYACVKVGGQLGGGAAQPSSTMAVLRDQTQAIRLLSPHLYSLSHLLSTNTIILKLSITESSYKSRNSRVVKLVMFVN